MSLEDAPEETNVLVTHGKPDLFDRRRAVLEHLSRRGDAQHLLVDSRHVAGGLLEPTQEVASAHACDVGEFLDRNVAGKTSRAKCPER